MLWNFKRAKFTFKNVQPWQEFEWNPATTLAMSCLDLALPSIPELFPLETWCNFQPTKVRRKLDTLFETPTANSKGCFFPNCKTRQSVAALLYQPVCCSVFPILWSDHTRTHVNTKCKQAPSQCRWDSKVERVPDIVATGQRWMNKKTVWAQYGKENYTSVHQTAAAAAKSGQEIGIIVKRYAIPLSDPSRIYIHGRVVTLLHSQSNCSNSIRFNFKNDKK